MSTGRPVWQELAATYLRRIGVDVGKIVEVGVETTLAAVDELKLIIPASQSDVIHHMKGRQSGQEHHCPSASYLVG